MSENMENPDEFGALIRMALRDEQNALDSMLGGVHSTEDKKALETLQEEINAAQQRVAPRLGKLVTIDGVLTTAEDAQRLRGSGRDASGSYNNNRRA